MTQLPLQELWNVTGALRAARRRHLRPEDIRHLLHRGPVSFVVANVGSKLEWTPLRDRFRFWNETVIEHVADDESFCLDTFPGGFCFVAEEWIAEGSDVTIVVLAVHH